MDGLEFKSAVTGIKVLDEGNGIVQAIVSVTNIVDNVKDNIIPGAYKDTLSRRTPKGLRGHDWQRMVAKTLHAEELMPGDKRVREISPKIATAGGGGLLVRGQYNLNTQLGRDAYEDAKFFGDEMEWSVGYKVPKGKSAIVPTTGVREIKAMDLYEWSDVAFGAAPLTAGTTSIKSAIAGMIEEGVLSTEEIEEWIAFADGLIGKSAEGAVADVTAALELSIDARAEWEEKTRKVRSAGGVRRFHAPIGSPIVPGMDGGAPGKGKVGGGRFHKPGGGSGGGKGPIGSKPSSPDVGKGKGPDVGKGGGGAGGAKKLLGDLKTGKGVSLHEVQGRNGMAVHKDGAHVGHVFPSGTESGKFSALGTPDAGGKVALTSHGSAQEALDHLTGGGKGGAGGNGPGPVADLLKAGEGGAKDTGKSNPLHDVKLTSAGIKANNDLNPDFPGVSKMGPPDLTTDNVDEALAALAEGKKVELKQPEQVSTLVNRLNEIVQDALSKGEKAPDYNLCNVSVKGTNLYCHDHKDMTRLTMPQLAGKPQPGSKAEAILKEQNAARLTAWVKSGKAEGDFAGAKPWDGGPSPEVDLSQHYRDHLASLGLTTSNESRPAANLKASQKELVGANVAGMVASMDNTAPDGSAIDPTKMAMPPGRIFVSRDGYVIDGHHRWAAEISRDLKDGKAGDINMDVEVVNADALDLLALTTEWTTMMGVPPKGGGKGAAEASLAASAELGGAKAGDAVTPPVPAPEKKSRWSFYLAQDDERIQVKSDKDIQAAVADELAQIADEVDVEILGDDDLPWIWDRCADRVAEELGESAEEEAAEGDDESKVMAAAALRRVRTSEGARTFHRPIGSPIVKVPNTPRQIGGFSGTTHTSGRMPGVAAPHTPSPPIAAGDLEIDLRHPTPAIIHHYAELDARNMLSARELIKAEGGLRKSLKGDLNLLAGILLRHMMGHSHQASGLNVAADEHNEDAGFELKTAEDLAQFLIRLEEDEWGALIDELHGDDLAGVKDLHDIVMGELAQLDGVGEADYRTLYVLHWYDGMEKMDVELGDLEEKVKSSAYPGLDRSPKKNWVDNAGGLPSYIERIAKHLHYEQGMTIGRAIATAVNQVKKWAAGGKNVTPETRAKAAKAVAEWEAKKAKSRAKTAAKNAGQAAASASKKSAEGSEEEKSTWTESLHPRSHGEFAPKGSGSTQKAPAQKAPNQNHDLVTPGNIDLHHRPVVHNADGSISTVRSITVTDDQGRGILIPTVSPDGKILNNKQALDLFRRTHQHLGVYKNEAAANKAAQQLHNDQAAEYLKKPTPTTTPTKPTGQRKPTLVGPAAHSLKADDPTDDPTDDLADDLAEFLELKRQFSAGERGKAADEGAALPDGSFPIKTAGDLKNAIQALGRAKDKEAAKAHIKKRAKALGAEDSLPDSWKDDGGYDVITTDLDALDALDALEHIIPAALEGKLKKHRFMGKGKTCMICKLSMEKGPHIGASEPNAVTGEGALKESDKKRGAGDGKGKGKDGKPEWIPPWKKTLEDMTEHDVAEMKQLVAEWEEGCGCEECAEKKGEVVGQLETKEGEEVEAPVDPDSSADADADEAMQILDAAEGDQDAATDPNEGGETDPGGGPATDPNETGEMDGGLTAPGPAEDPADGEVGTDDLDLPDQPEGEAEGAGNAEDEDAGGEEDAGDEGNAGEGKSTWNESLHPRQGGEFAPKNSGSGSGTRTAAQGTEVWGGRTVTEGPNANTTRTASSGPGKAVQQALAKIKSPRGKEKEAAQIMAAAIKQIEAMGGRANSRSAQSAVIDQAKKRIAALGRSTTSTAPAASSASEARRAPQLSGPAVRSMKAWLDLDALEEKVAEYEAKVGKVLSRSNTEAIQGALEGLISVLEKAGVDLSDLTGVGGVDDTVDDTTPDETGTPDNNPEQGKDDMLGDMTNQLEDGLTYLPLADLMEAAELRLMADV